jgi:TfoX/Sxy family transcriptional regulator of competence genes
MAYDEGLAQRIRELLAGQKALVEKKMFGGVAFMVRGNVACGVSGSDLMLRISPDRTDDALARPHVRPFDLTGKPMKGWVLVAPAGIESDDDLESWVRQGVAFARSLPAK